MKKYRTKSDWLTLIDEFEQSGLTQTKLCAQRGLNAKYFGLRRMKLKAKHESSGFTQAVRKPSLSWPRPWWHDPVAGGDQSLPEP